ncbi:MAG TPA: hypothetical protein VGC66_00980 [Pyrinomonadaceae bacterium]|jgi:hypothetical protein
MGSQSVTNFSDAKQKRIRELIKDYTPDSSEAEKQAQARAIGEAAVGALGKGPANEFLQALNSSSVDTALGLILYLARELKEDPQQVYKKYGIEPQTQQPFESVRDILRHAYTNMLSKPQKQTNATFAVMDAIPKTIMDVVKREFPKEEEPDKVDRKKFIKAFKKVGREEVITTFMENVASALIGFVLDATRGSLPPHRAAELKQSIRRRFVPEFIERIKRGK